MTASFKKINGGKGALDPIITVTPNLELDQPTLCKSVSSFRWEKLFLLSWATLCGEGA
jgi:hypothetical protein